MKHVLWLTLLIGPFAVGGSCPLGQTQDENALLQIEQSWGQALERHDADAVGCILAEEFQEVDLQGKVNDRAEMLSTIPHRRPGHNQLSEMHAHVYGSVGYVRGLNTVTDAGGKIRSKVRFTDIFVFRDGRWFAVAGQESLVSEIK